jgi:hypothetical protein
LQIDPGVRNVQAVACSDYGDLKLLACAFTAKFELLVDEEKQFWWRGGRANWFFGLCGPDRNFHQQETNNPKEKFFALHVETSIA